MTKRLRQGKEHLELRVVFDSNTIFTNSLTKLLGFQVTKLIKGSTDLTGLSLQWYIPEIVIHERRYQMINAAQDLLNSTKKLEKFLGEGLGVDTNAIEARVDEIINETLTKYHIQRIELNSRKVDWHKNLSVNR